MSHHKNGGRASLQTGSNRFSRFPLKRGRLVGLCEAVGLARYVHRTGASNLVEVWKCH